MSTRREEIPAQAGDEAEAGLLDSLRSIVLRWDPQGRIRYINRYGAELFGYDPDELIGRHVIGTIVEETDSSGRDLAFMIEDITRNPEAYADNENENITADGRRLWIQWSNRSILDDQGQLLEILSVGQDMTERRIAELALRALAASSRDGDQGLFEQMVRNLAQAYDARHAMIALIDTQVSDADAVGWMQTVAHVKDGAPMPPQRYPLPGSPCAEVLAHGSLLLASGVRTRYPDDAILQDLGMEGYYGVRLMLSDHVAGLVAVFDDQPLRIRPWNRDLIHVFADRITSELERQQQESEQRLAAEVYHNSNEGIVITDARLRIERANRAFERMAGHSEAELIGHSALQLGRTVNERRVLHDMLRSLREYGYWWGEVQYPRPDGSTLPCWLSVSGIPDGAGGIAHYVALFTDISEQKRAQERIHHLAHHDTLTGLANRGRFLEALDEALRSHQILALLYIDLDRFKPINDRLGHAAGDQVLQEVARRLRHSVRSNDLLARLGCDEFALLQSGFESLEEARASAEQTANRLLRVLTRTYLIEGQEALLSASIGIALTEGQKPIHVEELLSQADIAMYRIKHQGRNGFRFFEPAMAERVQRRLGIEERLRRALAQQQIGLHLQPILNLDSNRIHVVEALARWDDGIESNIGTEEFIRVAEETGLIVQLGQRVIERTLQEMGNWRRKGVEVRASINLSLRQLAEPDLVVQLEHALHRFDIPADQVVLEITESSMMEDAERALSILNALANLGIRLSIDDFGTGYSSLAHLRRFPVHCVKIDRSFVEEIDGRPGARNEIVRAAVAMAHGMGLKVVAEGVATPAQRAFLASLHCDQIQGYLISPPLPPEDCLQFVRDWNQTAAGASDHA
ncbi:MAG: EAL domain-containing protein [Gammaproteobacteria bacterium]|nr:MAG: EAL domain-containing protein [Gammaproteobacteria bacterium]